MLLSSESVKAPSRTGVCSNMAVFLEKKNPSSATSFMPRLNQSSSSRVTFLQQHHNPLSIYDLLLKQSKEN